MEPKNNKKDPSSQYRKRLGEILKLRRIEYGYSIQDIIYLTGLSKSSVLKVESGEAKIIDFYVNYAVSVEYALATLTDLKIKLTSIRSLPPERKERTRLTQKIREYIIEAGFLKHGKSVSEIKDKLISLKLIDTKNVSSTEIAGVMRNFVNDEIVKIENKEGRKNIYIKK